MFKFLGGIVIGAIGMVIAVCRGNVIIDCKPKKRKGRKS